MDEQNDQNQFESVRALVRGLHGPPRNVSRPISEEDSSNENSKNTSHNSLVNLDSRPDDLHHQNRKLFDHHNIFEHSLKIPTLLITGPTSPLSCSSPTSPENPHRRFSFGGLRRLSHSQTVFDRLERISFANQLVGALCDGCIDF